MCKRLTLILLMVLAMGAAAAGQESPLPGPAATAPTTPQILTLSQAVMCEGIMDFAPLDPAVTFSISLGKVTCFTAFDPVPENTYIHHKWFHRDKLITTIRLFLRPPRWSTFSSIQLRSADKGPWRVEVRDAGDKLLQVLRFSITD